MKIQLHKSFKKSFEKRVAHHPNLVTRFKQRLALFLENPYHPTLKNHELIGKRISLRAFSITGDIRVVYASLSETEVLFLDIGTHNQVY